LTHLSLKLAPLSAVSDLKWKCLIGIGDGNAKKHNISYEADEGGV